MSFGFEKPEAPEICKRMAHCKGILHVCGRRLYHAGKHQCFCRYTWRNRAGFEVCSAWKPGASPTENIDNGEQPIQLGVELFTNERRLALED